MNKKSILEVIKNILLLTEETEPEVQLEMAMAELIDGTKVEVESIEIGQPVSVVMEDGTKVPAPDGEHTLSDGTKIKTEGGVITEIESPEAEMAGYKDKDKEKMSEFDEQIVSLKEEVKRLKESNIELAKEVEELLKAPATEPINFKKEKSYMEMTPYERHMFEKSQKK